MLHSPQQNGSGNDYYLSLKRGSLFLDRERQHDSQVLHNELSPYRQDPAPSGLCSSGLGRLASGLVTQVCICVCVCVCVCFYLILNELDP